MSQLQLIAMCCDSDDFCTHFAPLYQQRLGQAGQRQRTRATALTLSELLTLLVSFHWSHSRTLKHSYTAYVMAPWRPYCPRLRSYTRFVELLPRALVPCCCYLHTRQGRCPGIACIDSTPLAVCDQHRRATHRVWGDIATRGKTSRGWLYGCTLHLSVNDAGELLALRLTPGHGEDRQPVPRLVQGLCGQLFGDRGSIAQALHDTLWAQGLELLTQSRQNMKHRVMRLWDTLLLRKRALIEML
jgi:Transposase DDE domain